MSRRPHRPRLPVQQITSPDQLPLICTSDEAARLLRCTPEQIQKRARAGDIPAFKDGESPIWLFRREDLLRHIDTLSAAFLRGTST